MRILWFAKIWRNGYEGFSIDDLKVNFKFLNAIASILGLRPGVPVEVVISSFTASDKSFSLKWNVAFAYITQRVTEIKPNAAERYSALILRFPCLVSIWFTHRKRDSPDWCKYTLLGSDSVWRGLSHCQALTVMFEVYRCSPWRYILVPHKAIEVGLNPLFKRNAKKIHAKAFLKYYLHWLHSISIYLRQRLCLRQASRVIVLHCRSQIPVT